MTRARHLLLVPLLVVAAGGLTACAKPDPGVTAFSGTTSVYREAACWSADGTALSDTSCSAEQLAPPASATIPTVAGQTIGISVDPAVAEIGWFPMIGSTRLTEVPVTSTYFRFTPTSAQVATPTTLAVLAADEAGTRGIWTYHLVPAALG